MIFLQSIKEGVSESAVADRSAKEFRVFPRPWHVVLYHRVANKRSRRDIAFSRPGRLLDLCLKSAEYDI